MHSKPMRSFLDGQLIDITLPLRDGSSTWPGEGRALRRRIIATRSSGAVSNTSAYDGSVHLGTHVDAPRHFWSEGACVSQLPLDLFLGPARVVEVLTPGHISLHDLRSAVPDPPRRLLLKTRNSMPEGSLSAIGFDRTYCALTLDAATWAVDRGVELIGIDAFSVAPFEDPIPVHEAFLRSGRPILEGLDLRLVAPGDYLLIAMPLRLQEFDGSPVRAVLVPM